MKTKIFVWVSLLLTLSFAACEYDDTELWNKLNNQEERLAALEKWQEATNNNITALQELISTTDYITSVSPILQGKDTIGYNIAFQNSDPISIYHGTTSQIGVSQGKDGSWYWTIDGEILKDSSGNPVSANGKEAPTPQMSTGKQLKDKQITTDAEGHAIVTDASYLSVDEGKTWHRVSGEKGDTGPTGPTGPIGPSGPSGSAGDSFFQTVTEEDDYVLFILKNPGGTFKVPKYKGGITFSLGGIELTDLTQTIDIGKGDLTFSVTENGAVSVRILEGNGWKAEVYNTNINITGTIGTSALLEVTLMDNGKVIEIYRLKLTNSTFPGEGTQDSPYKISSAEELSYLAKQVNEGTSYNGEFFQLTQNIDLNNATWTSIGTVRVGSISEGKPFKGIFDGQSNTIFNLKMNTTDIDLAQGLFGYNKGVIKNLILENVSIKGCDSQGALAGDNRGTIENCHVKGTVTVEGTNSVGGLVGTNYGNSNSSPATVTDCSVSGNVIVKVTGTSNIFGGGVIGNNIQGKVTACRFQGKLSGSKEGSMGGVVGCNNAQVTACYANCEFESYPTFTGGVIGTNYTSSIANYSIVASSNNIIGGVCGSNRKSINACFWKKSGAGFFPTHGIHNSFDDYYNPDKVSNENATQVTGDSWNEALTTMNSALSDTGWQYKKNTGTDSSIFPLIIEKTQSN